MAGNDNTTGKYDASLIRAATRAVGLLLMLAPIGPALAQIAPARTLITAPVDEHEYTRLAGNTRTEANARNDRGRVPDALALEHVLLLLKRPAEREMALARYLEELHRRGSPSFHHWLTDADLARRFGLAPQDIDAMSRWLERHGLKVNGVYPGALLLDFSGSAGAVAAAFHTEIHYLEVRGRRHIANMSDPAIPTALTPAVSGIVSLHDFRPRTYSKPRSAYALGGGFQAVVPADLATIYNLGPLFSGGYFGRGQQIVVIEDTTLYNPADWSAFRAAFGLNAYPGGSLTQINPAPPVGTNNCSNPGVVPYNEFEAELDVEWASAAAPGAAIVLAACADTSTTFGGLIALENLLSSQSPPAIVSISYGECEALNGASANAAYNSVYQQAVALGTSVFVAAGDEGAASCDPGQADAVHGIGVSAFASTIYNVAVGGTDFGDTYAGSVATYWSASNGPTYGSALSYVPEIPWNDSCASTLIAAYNGSDATYGGSGFCNSSSGGNFLITTAASGGPSGCASGAPAVEGVVGGSCRGYAKPSWQSLLGVPADGVRDLPDVSLFSANGIWLHYYVVCDSDSADGYPACSGAPSTWAGGGGTSFATPILAGIQALVNQRTGERQGNPNYVYYALAAAEYGASGSAACNSSAGNAVSSSCVFYDVTQGDMDIPCTGTSDCYLPSGTNGVLSTSDGGYAKAYGTGVGWDFATGMGSLNAFNLANSWNSGTAYTADLVLTGTGKEGTVSGQLSYNWTVSNEGPQSATGTVLTTVLPAGFSLVTGSSSGGCHQSGQFVTCAIGTLAKNAMASVTIVVQSGSASSALLVFVASSSNSNLAFNQATVTIQLDDGATDAPLPVWSYGALALGLTLAARRRYS